MPPVRSLHSTPTIIPPADTLEEGVARQREWALPADPGTRYRYSNGNFWTAARLVEVVSGVGFDDYLQTNLFEPLRMNDTVSTTSSDERVAGLADGHVLAYGRGVDVARDGGDGRRSGRRGDDSS